MINRREIALEILEKIIFPLENKCLQEVRLHLNDCSSISAIYLHKINDSNIDGGFPAGRFLHEISKIKELNEFQKKAVDYLDNIDYIEWKFSIQGNLGEKYFELKIKFLEEKYIISFHNFNCQFQYEDIPNEEDMMLIISEFERLIL